MDKSDRRTKTFYLFVTFFAHFVIIDIPNTVESPSVRIRHILFDAYVSESSVFFCDTHTYLSFLVFWMALRRTATVSTVTLRVRRNAFRSRMAVYVSLPCSTADQVCQWRPRDWICRMQMRSPAKFQAQPAPFVLPRWI